VLIEHTGTPTQFGVQMKHLFVQNHRDFSFWLGPCNARLTGLLPCLQPRNQAEVLVAPGIRPGVVDVRR
jgi:hypothetical protein